METIGAHDDQVEVIKGIRTLLSTAKLDTSEHDDPLPTCRIPQDFRALDFYSLIVQNKIAKSLMFPSPSSIAASPKLRIRNLSLWILFLQHFRRPRFAYPALLVLVQVADWSVGLPPRCFNPRPVQHKNLTANQLSQP